MIRNRWESEIEQDRDRLRSQRFTLGEPGSWPRILWARWPWVLIITAAVTAAGAVFSKMQPPIYKAQAEVAVYANGLSSSAVQPFVMGTEKGIASSGAVLSIASASLGMPQKTLQQELAISVPTDSDLLVIAFSDPSPRVAQSGAEAVAQAYVAYRSWASVPSQAKAAASSATSGPVQVAIVTDAALPTAPDSPNRKLIVVVALVLGLALGIGIALLRDAIDDGLRGAMDLQAQANAAVLALIPAFSRRGRSLSDALVMLANPGSGVAEAYRKLRTRLLQIARRRAANLVLVTSAGPEEKSIVAANLAAALAQSGRRVVLVCADLRWGRACELFGLENRLGLADLVTRNARLTEVLHGTQVAGLQVLPGGQVAFDPASVVQSPAFRTLLGQLRTEADFVVIDAPPLLGSAETPALADLGGMVLLVADARVSTRAAVRAAAAELGPVREQLIGCVFDNVGGPIRLPQPSITSAIRIVSDRTKSDQPLRDDGLESAVPETEREPVTSDAWGGVSQ